MVKVDGGNYGVNGGQNNRAASELNAAESGKKAGTADKGSSQDTSSLSDRSIRLSAIDQELSSYLKDNPLPRYFSNSTHNDRVAEKAQAFGQELGVELDADDIDHLVTAHAKQKPNLSFDSGNVFDFLRESDRLELEKAHQYAAENDTSLKDVEKAAFEMGVKLRRQAMEANGTRFVKLDKNADISTLFTIDQGGHLADKGRIEEGSAEHAELVERFSDNPFLTEFLPRIIAGINN